MSVRIVYTDYTKKTHGMRGLFPMPEKKCRGRAAIDNPAEMGYSKRKDLSVLFGLKKKQIQRRNQDAAEMAAGRYGFL